jgi:uncharacterized membrane protein
MTDVQSVAGEAMHALYVVSVWLHLVAAVVWVGGMVFVALVLVPALRRPAPLENRVEIVQRTGVRFRRVGWIALGVLVATGVGNLWLRGIGPAELLSGAFWTTRFGKILALKVALVAAMALSSVVHDFVVGPRATRALRAGSESPEAMRLRRTASALGRGNLLVALAVLALAVLLVRGVPW